MTADSEPRDDLVEWTADAREDRESWLAEQARLLVLEGD
jgi:hypothetical protein